MEILHIRCDAVYEIDAGLCLAALYWQLYRAAQKDRRVRLRMLRVQSFLRSEHRKWPNENTGEINKVSPFQHSNQNFALWVNHHGKTHAERLRSLRSLINCEKEIVFEGVSLHNDNSAQFLIDFVKVVCHLGQRPPEVHLTLQKPCNASDKCLAAMFALCTRIEFAHSDLEELKRCVPLSTAPELSLHIRYRNAMNATSLIERLPKLDLLEVHLEPDAFYDTRYFLNMEDCAPYAPIEEPVLDLDVPCVTPTTRLLLELNTHTAVRIKIPHGNSIERLRTRKWCYTSAHVRYLVPWHGQPNERRFMDTVADSRDLEWLKSLEVLSTWDHPSQEGCNAIIVVCKDMNRESYDACAKGTLALLCDQYKQPDMLIMRPLRLDDYRAILMWLSIGWHRDRKLSEWNFLSFVITLEVCGIGRILDDTLYEALLLQAFIVV
eukprot:TRINITY_DN4552_c0_g1_i1.p1 TRINITY_DN4552_c0_g1~~TRINITY_DN4552_c0_g1_i1.p1  ORF type:complete len:448 (+),score=44.36 TRINITY_DN4552_c0_g1_i1:40-1344(+)